MGSASAVDAIRGLVEGVLRCITSAVDYFEKSSCRQAHVEKIIIVNIYI